MAKKRAVGRILGIGFLFLLIVCAALAWFARKPIAKHFATSWCTAHNITCEFEIAQIGFATISLEDLSVAGPTEPKLLAARTVSIEIDWPSLFQPSIGALRADQPIVSAAFDGQRLTLDGLEDLIQTSGSGDGETAFPALTITDGQLNVATPAGSLTGSFSVAGTWPEQGSAELIFAPAELNTGEERLTVERATLVLNTIAGEVAGSFDLILGEVLFDGLSANNLQISARLVETRQQQLVWTAQLDRLQRGRGQTLSGIDARGEIDFADLPGTADISGLDLINRFSATGTLGPSVWANYGADSLSFDVKARRGSDNQLDLELETIIRQASSSALTGREISLSFSGQADEARSMIRGSGNVVLTQMGLAAPLKAKFISGITVGAPFDRHARSLRGALAAALSNFTTGGAYRINARGVDDWRITLPQTLALRTESGFSAVLTPPASRAPLTLEPGRANIAGVLNLKGGGVPTMDADIRELRLDSGNLKIRTGGITVTPWRTGPIVLAADLNQFEFDNQDGDLRLTALGEFSMEGKILGVDLDRTRLFGGIAAANGAEGWRVQTIERDCLGLNLGRTRTNGDLTLDAVTLNICPENGRFIRQENGYPMGRLTLGDMSLPFSGKDMSGSANLSNATIDWAAKNSLRMDIDGGQFSLPMQIGSRSFSLATQAPSLQITLSDSPGIRATFKQTKLGGDLVPANVAVGAATFAGHFRPSGFEGTAQATEVSVTDIHPDPYYRPLLASFNADFRGARMAMSGAIRLADTQHEVADASLNIDLLQLNGTAQLKSRQLRFARRGLQPKDLSDRVRGFLSNGRGVLSGLAKFDIRNGQLSGTGEIQAVNFGFDTLRLGAVDGIEGEVKFSDIMALTTPPSQRVTIGSLNPGVPLENGTLTFQIIGGKQARIERAIWPFAGGSIELDPADWTIAGSSDALMVNANQIELARLIEVFSLPDIRAEGTISGPFPIELQGGKALIQNAELRADNKGGYISYTGDAAGQAGSADDRIQAAFTALRDFQFKVLEIGIDGDLMDDVIVSARLLGSSPEVYGGAEFDFNISVDSKLGQLLKSGRRAVTSKWLTEAVVTDPPEDTP